MIEATMLFAPTEKVDFMFAGPITTTDAGGSVSTSTGGSIDLGETTGGFTPFPGDTAASGGTIGGGSTLGTSTSTGVVEATGSATTTTGTATAAGSTASTTIEQTKDIANALSSNILWAILFVIGAAFAGYLFVAKK